MKADFGSLFIYMLFLTITLGLLWLLQHTKIRGKLSIFGFLVVVCIPLSVLAGLRHNVGTDFASYCNIFEIIKYNTFSEAVERTDLEPLFVLIVKTISFFIKSNSFIFFAIEFMTLIPVAITIYRFRDKLSMPFAFLLYYLNFYHMSLNILRQMLAVSIVFFGLYYLIKKRYLVYCITNLLAVFIHTSTILCFSFLLVPLLFSFLRGKLKRNKWIPDVIFYTIIVLSPVIIRRLISIVLSLSIFEKYAHRFVTGEVSIGIGTIAFAIMLILPVIIIAWNIINKDESLMIMKNLYIMYLPFSFVGYFVTWASRINYYPLVIPVLFIPAVIRASRGYNKIFLTAYYLTVFVGIYVYDILIRNLNETFPYVFMSL